MPIYKGISHFTPPSDVSVIENSQNNYILNVDIINDKGQFIKR